MRGVVKDAPYNILGDLWTLDFASGRLTRLTFKKERVLARRVVPGQRPHCLLGGHLGDTMYEKAVSGLGDARVLFSSRGCGFFQPAGREMAASCSTTPKTLPDTGYDLWALSVPTANTISCSARLQSVGRRLFTHIVGSRMSPSRRAWVGSMSARSECHPDRRAFPRRGQVAGLEDNGNWPAGASADEIIFNTTPGGMTTFAAPVKVSGSASESGVPQLLPLPPNIDWSLRRKPLPTDSDSWST